VLQALAAWREEQAVKQDRPRRWLLKDELIIDLSRLMPDTPAKLDKMRGLEGSSAAKFGAEWVGRIAAAKRLPREQWPVLDLAERLTPQQEAVVDLMLAVLRQIGAEQGVSPSAIANRRDLEQVVLGRHDVPLLHGWRDAVAGQALSAVAQGRVRVRVERGALVLEAA
jgi:ribonuclease D